MGLDQQYRPALVHRHGRVLCTRARVKIRAARRLDSEDSYVQVVFADGVASELHHELAEMIGRRGAAAARYAERIEPVTIIVEAPQGRVELRGRIKPPSVAQTPDLHHAVFSIGPNA